MLTSRRRKQKSNKLRSRTILCGIIAIILLIVRFARRSFTATTPVQTWSNLSWAAQSGVDALSPLEEAILNDLPLTWIDQEQLSTGSSLQTWETNKSKGMEVKQESWSQTAFTSQTPTAKVSTTTAQKTQNTDLFPVDLCNRIINLYQCIIDHAPIENQDIMQQNLKKSTSQRTLLASPQLSEVCQKISKDSTFILVRDHYATWDFNCTF